MKIKVIDINGAAHRVGEVHQLVVRTPTQTVGHSKAGVHFFPGAVGIDPEQVAPVGGSRHVQTADP